MDFEFKRTPYLMPILGSVYISVKDFSEDDFFNAKDIRELIRIVRISKVINDPKNPTVELDGGEIINFKYFRAKEFGDKGGIESQVEKHARETGISDVDSRIEKKMIEMINAPNNNQWHERLLMEIKTKHGHI